MIEIEKFLTFFFFYRQTPAKIDPNKLALRLVSMENANPVHVFCRIKPLTDGSISCMRVELPKTVVLSPPENAVNYKLGNLKETKYSFSDVFDGSAEQEEVYQVAAQPLVEALIKGENGLLFTYGVTGSGKTYTMTGNLKSRGIMSRCLEFLFESIKGSQSKKYVFKSDKMNGFEVVAENEADIVGSLENYFEKYNRKNRSTDKGSGFRGKTNIFAVFVNYVEVYNNSVFDLLEHSSIQNRNTLQSRIIREDANHNMYVHGVTELEVQSADEAIQAFNLGQKRKRIGHTILNANSSRSHSIFTIRLVQTCIDTRYEKDTGPVNISQLSLVDLAGSERLSRTKNTGQRLKEAGNINNSLMTLRTCLELLRENQMTGSQKKIPYRDSKLTNLFKNYFEGNGWVKMIVCVSPRAEDYDETAQVMKFAEMTQDIQIVKTTPPTPTIHFNDDKFDFKRSLSFYNFGTFPHINLNAPCQRLIINELCNTLENRIVKRSELSQNVNEMMSNFRSRLTETVNHNTNYKSELRVAQLNAKKSNDNINNLERKILHLERCLKDVGSYTKEIETENFKLKRDMDDQKALMTKNSAKEMENKQLLYDDLGKKKQQLQHDYQQKLKEQKQVFEEKYKHESKKLEVLTQILNAHEINVNEIDTVEHRDESHGVPVSNPRYRRSKSVEHWVEHRTKPTVPLGTIFQPFYKSRKSITRVDESDLINNKASNYCLVDQVAKGTGEIETKLFKGDIIPTTAGGAQVIFNDVECLTQKSPTSSNDRKRICSVSIQDAGSTGTPSVTIKRTKI